MKNRMRLFKRIAVAVSSCAAVLCASVSASAAAPKSCRTWISRGKRYISYCRTDFSWSIDSRINITESSAYQQTSGLCVEAGGTERIETNPLEHTWIATTKSTVSVSFFGFGTTFTVLTHNDEVHLSNSGEDWVIWD